jgi:hypothetical protein
LWIVEVSPPYDHAEITALAAATIDNRLGILGLAGSAEWTNRFRVAAAQ